MTTENKNNQPAIVAELNWSAKQREIAAVLFDTKSLSLFAEKVQKFQK